MYLLCFPFELLLLILDHLPDDSLRSLRGASKFFLSLLNPRLFSDLTLNLQSRNGRKDIELIRSISNCSCTYTDTISLLRITSLEIKSSVTDYEALGGERAAKDLLWKHLAPSIKQMRCLTVVHWKYNLDGIDQSGLDTVCDALSSLSSLTHLNMLGSGSMILRDHFQYPTLKAFKDLQHLYVEYILGIPPKYFEEQITPVLEASPELSSCIIRSNSTRVWKDEDISSRPLPRLFGNAALDLVDLELSDISLPAIELGGAISDTLQSLNISTPPGSVGVDFPWADLWHTIQEAEVQLCSLTVQGSEKAMDEMFAYLLSYSGLETLEISDILMDNLHMENDAGIKFWEEVVPHHKESLTDIAATCQYGSTWCYGPTAAVALAECSSLRNLSLSLYNVDDSWAQPQLDKASNVNHVDIRELQDTGKSAGEAQNCAALALFNLRRPLRELSLSVASNPADHGTDLRGWNLDLIPFGDADPQTELNLLKRQLVSLRIIRVLYGLQGPVTACQNWPTYIKISDKLFFKRPHSKKKDTWTYET